MPITALFIGGPLDGELKTLPDTNDVSCSYGTIHTYITTTYIMQKFWAGLENDVPAFFYFYAPKEMNAAEMFRKLVSGYKPEKDCA